MILTTFSERRHLASNIVTFCSVNNYDIYKINLRNPLQIWTKEFLFCRRVEMLLSDNV